MAGMQASAQRGTKSACSMYVHHACAEFSTLFAFSCLKSAHCVYACWLAPAMHTCIMLVHGVNAMANGLACQNAAASIST